MEGNVIAFTKNTVDISYYLDTIRKFCGGFIWVICYKKFLSILGTFLNIVLSKISCYNKCNFITFDSLTGHAERSTWDEYKST